MFYAVIAGAATAATSSAACVATVVIANKWLKAIFSVCNFLSLRNAPCHLSFYIKYFYARFLGFFFIFYLLLFSFTATFGGML